MSRMLARAGVVAALCTPLLALAAYNDVSLGSSAIVSSGGATMTVTGSDTLIQSITIGSSSFSLVMPAHSVFRITDTSSHSFVVNSTAVSYISTKGCDSASSTLAFEAGIDSVNVTVTPQSSTCSGTSLYIPPADTGSGSGGGGGGGSGSAGSSGTSGVSVIPGIGITQGTAQVTVTTPTTPSSVSGSVSGTAGSVAGASTLKAGVALGMQSASVSTLQKLLAQDKSVYPEGKVTGYFGSLTTKALQRFQVKYGLAKAGDPGFGTLGPKTRAQLLKLYGK